MNSILRLLLLALNIVAPETILLREAINVKRLREATTTLRKETTRYARLLSREGFKELVASPLIGEVLEAKDKINPETIARFFKSTPKRLTQLILTEPERVAVELGQLTTEGRRVLGKSLAIVARGEGADASTLSSSWITFGVYEPLGINGTVGSLTITTVQGKSYTYYNVPLTVWVAMKEAKGRNGSGAGTVFWALYLRGYEASVSGQLTRSVFQRAIRGA